MNAENKEVMNSFLMREIKKKYLIVRITSIVLIIIGAIGIGAFVIALNMFLLVTIYSMLDFPHFPSFVMIAHSEGMYVGPIFLISGIIGRKYTANPPRIKHPLVCSIIAIVVSILVNIAIFATDVAPFGLLSTVGSIVCVVYAIHVIQFEKLRKDGVEKFSAKELKEMLTKPKQFEKNS